MSLSSIPGFSPSPSARVDAHDHDQVARRETSVSQPSARPASSSAASPTAARARTTGGALPAEAPEGTDRALWNILTREERAFFARSTTSGPLTYAKVMRADRGTAPAGPTARGGRVDVRV